MAKKSRAERKKEAAKPLNSGNQKQQENKALKVSDKKDEQKKQYIYEPQESPKLTAYTAFSMLAVLISSITAAIAMCMLAKPVGYVMEAYYGGIGDQLYINMFKNEIFSKASQNDMVKIFTAIAILVVIVAVLSIVDVLKVLNAKNKPLLVISIIAFIMSGVALAIYLYESNFIDGQLEMYYVEYEPVFNVYKILFIALICNVVFSLFNIIGNVIGYSKWKKTRQAY